MTDAAKELEAIFAAMFGEAAGTLMSDHPHQWHVDRQQQCPIDHLGGGTVMLRRMDDIQAVTRSRDVRQFGPEIMESMHAEGMGLGGRHVAIPIELDGPEHTKWRKILDPLFAPRKIAVLEQRVRARAGELIDAFVDRGEVDAYAEWCEPLPSSVFLSIMGIPQSELASFLEFKTAILPPSDMITQQFTLAERRAAFDRSEARFDAEFDRREASGEHGDDIIGWLLQVEVDGRRITRSELQGICSLLMVAGLDTVASSLSCMLARLASRPELRARLLAEPELWPNAIEELMRFESPVTQGFRHVVADVEVPSGTIPAGSNVIVWWAAANVDADVFEDPTEVRLDRESIPHVAFASGWHRCLGSHLARLELRAALDVWHSRIPDYRIADGADLRFSMLPRTPRHLPLVWD